MKTAAIQQGHPTSAASLDSGAFRGSLKNYLPPRVRGRDQAAFERDLSISRVEDLYGNDGIAKSGVNSIATNVIGTGLTPQSVIPAKRLGLTPEDVKDVQDQMEWLWSEWCGQAHYREQLGFEDLQLLGLRSLIRNGELVHLPVMEDRPGCRFALRIQDIRPSRLRTPWDKQYDPLLHDGVELTPTGVPLAYWIANPAPSTFPGGGIIDDSALTSGAFRRIPARIGHRRGLFHIFRPEAEEQFRAYNWGVRSRHLTANPLTGLRLPTAKPQRIMPPSVREARLIHDAAAPHVRRVVVLGMATGARIGPSELFRLRWSDVDVAAGVIRMPNAAKGARDEARDVPIRDDILGLVRQWQAEDAAAGCPWVIHYRGARVRSVGKAWRNALRRAGITRRIRPYDLRHAFPSAALAHGADIKCVAEVMGHKDASMLLKVYQHTLFRERRRAVNAAPGLFAGSGRRQSAPRNRSGSKPDPSPRTLPPGPERVTASLAPVPVPVPAAPSPDRPPADSP